MVGPSFVTTKCDDRRIMGDFFEVSKFKKIVQFLGMSYFFIPHSFQEEALQSLMVLSLLADARVIPSGENAIEKMESV